MLRLPAPRLPSPTHGNSGQPVRLRVWTGTDKYPGIHSERSGFPWPTARGRFDGELQPIDPQRFRTGGLHTPSVFVAFDLLDGDGHDLTCSPLVERKQRLQAIPSKSRRSVLPCYHIEATGEELFALACKNDLEGIVAKHKFGSYRLGAVVQDPQPEMLTVGGTFTSCSSKNAQVIPNVAPWNNCVLAGKDFGVNSRIRT